MHWGMGGNVVVWTYESREKLNSLRWKGKDHCHGWFAKRCVRTVLKYTELSMDSMTLVCLCVFLLGWCRNAGFHHCVIVGYLFLVNQSWRLLCLLPLMMIPSDQGDGPSSTHCFQPSPWDVRSRSISLWEWLDMVTAGRDRYIEDRLVTRRNIFFQNVSELLHYDSAWTVLRWPMDVCFVSWWRGRTKPFLIRRASVWNEGDRWTSATAARKLLFFAIGWFVQGDRPWNIPDILC